MPAYMGWGEFLAVASSVVYSVTMVSLRQGMRSGSPLAAVLTINLVVCAAGLVGGFFRGTLQTAPLPFLFWFALAGCVGPGLGHITAYIGIERMGVSRATPVTQSSPIWGALFAVMVLGERPGLAVILGTACIVSGVILLSLAEREEGRRLRDWFRGELIFPLTTSVCFAIAPVLVKLAYAHHRAPIFGMGVGYATGTLILLLGRRLLPGRGEIRAEGGALRWFLLGGVCNILATSAINSAFMVGDVSVVLPLSRVSPLWVLLLSYFFLGAVERITWRIALAAFLTVAGGVLITAFRV